MMKSVSENNAEYTQLSLFSEAELGKGRAASFDPPDPLKLRRGSKRGVVSPAYNNNKKKWRFYPGTTIEMK